MKLFTYNCIYRGQQITKQVCAKNIKEAAEKLEINTYNVKTYSGVSKAQKIFDGVIASFDSGMLFEKEKDLIRKKMSFEELKAIIDKHK